MKKNKIPLECYVDIFKQILNLHNELFVDDNRFKLIAVDVTYNNIKGLLETSLNPKIFLDLLISITIFHYI